jgi:hypothetical protein
MLLFQTEINSYQYNTKNRSSLISFDNLSIKYHQVKILIKLGIKNKSIHFFLYLPILKITRQKIKEII